MNNYWLNRAESRAMTMEQKIEKMLAPHHVIWLGDDSIGADAPKIPDAIMVDASQIPSEITINCPMPMIVEWDFNTTITVGAQTVGTAGVCSVITSDISPHSDLPATYFDINTFSAEIQVEVEKALENEFARMVESEGWNLDL